MDLQLIKSIDVREVQKTEPLPVTEVQKTEKVELIRAGVSDNTLKAYRHTTQKLETWLSGRVIDDGLLAQYITDLHSQGKSPTTIALVVAAVKWQAKDLSRRKI